MIELTLYQYVMLYVVSGLITLLILIRIARSTPDDYEAAKHSLGQLVLYSIVGWPYIFVLWVFSWEVWLKPIPLAFLKYPR